MAIPKLPVDIQPAIWALSMVWAARLPGVDFTAAFWYGLIIFLSYLPYAHQWYAPAYVPKELWETQTKLFSIWVVSIQKLLWLATLYPVCRVPVTSLLVRFLAQPAVIQVAGSLCIALGQHLNVSVFRAIGYDGVFYGHRYGKKIPWAEGWPFVVPDPQYLGVTLTFFGCGMLTCSYVLQEPNGFILGMTAGNAFAHVLIVQMERYGETRNSKQS